MAALYLRAGSPIGILRPHINCVSANTTAGDVVVELPPAMNAETMIHLRNVEGSGSFQINAGSHNLIEGDSMIVLGPGDRISLVSSGSGWYII